jgi:hypothetical protein
MPGNRTLRDWRGGAPRKLSSVVAAVALAVMFMPPFASPAPAEPRSLKERLVGTWIFVSSISTRRDGTPYDRWGTNPKGVLMFDASGRYSQIIMRSQTRMFGAKTIFSFGTYTIDEADRMVVTQIEGASVSRLIGKRQRRKVELLTADELRYVNLDGLSGAVIESVWKRAPTHSPYSASLVPKR